MDQTLILNKILEQQNLNIEESMYIFNKIMSGELDDIKITSILIGLKLKGETKEEIIGAAKVMREKSLKINSPQNTIDTCGTGGDMKDTLNISTSAAIVAASAGVTIAKHGNRSVSSKSGSADMLEKIGYKITNNVEDLENSLSNKNFCFLFAQNHHSAMKNVINVRKNLATRTIFNLLGPLTNPAKASKQLLGVYSSTNNDTIFIAYSARAINENIVIGSESVDVSWFEVNHLPSLAFKHDQKILQRWKDLYYKSS